MNKNTVEHVCSKCGETFIYRRRNDQVPSCCSYCYGAMKRSREQQLEAQKQQIENEKWLKQSIADKKCFEEQLQHTATVPIEELKPQGRTLYIIGNGFDLMHGVKSSYRAFRDSLGKNSDLRVTLECYLKPEDIWADFEDALGHVNMDMMANPDVVGDMLELSGFFDEDSGAAEYYMALEMAAEPMRCITEDLEKKFRAWIERLEIGTNDRPLKSLIQDDKLLCFNYTEFAEVLYGVSESNICYIHGCRRKKKGHPKGKLILGHKPGAAECEYDLIRSLRRKKSYRSQVIEVAQEGVVRLLSEYDEDLTKDCQVIIAAHMEFFQSLTEIDNVVVIGHSLSPVDWDYFLEVARYTPDACWYVGCHDIYALKNMQRLAAALGIEPVAFRTDGISVTRIPEAEQKVPVRKPSFKSMKSPDSHWQVQWLGKKIKISGSESQTSRIMQEAIRRCVFSPSGDVLFVIIDGLDAGVPFFRLIDGKWVYIDELENIPNQNLLNRRLQHVYVKEGTITFVYNSRIREYSLETGVLIRNQAKRDAKSGHYEGQEISRLLLGKRV